MKVLRGIVTTLCAAVLMGNAPQAAGQYLYLDADGDGARTTADLATKSAVADLGVYLITDRNRDESASQVAGDKELPLTLFSYELIFHAVGGEVEWVSYKNEQPTMPSAFRQSKSSTDYYVAYGGMDPLLPGKYRLGTLKVRTTSGVPRIVFAPSTPLGATLMTSFGSKRPGRDDDNTLKLAASSGDKAQVEYLGDWVDTDGVSMLGAVSSSEAISGALSEAGRFRISFGPVQVRGRGLLMIETPSPGPMRVRLFDLQGRLVRTIVDDPVASAGGHSIPFQATDEGGHRLSAGVYFYRAEAGKLVASGKVTLVR
jgi:hypothetical protein